MIIGLMVSWGFLLALTSFAGSVSASLQQRSQFQQSKFGLKARNAAKLQYDEALITPAAELPVAQPSQIAVLVMGTETFTLEAENGNILFGSATLVAGAAAQTIDGQSVSFGSDGVVIDGSSTFPVNGLSTNAVEDVQGAIITAGNFSFTYTAGAADLDLGLTMLTPGGPPATVGGLAISIDDSGVFVNGELVPVTELGAAAPPTNTTAPASPVTQTPGVGFDASTPSPSVFAGGASPTDSEPEPVFIQFSGPSDTPSSAKSGKGPIAEFSNNGSILESGYFGVLAAVILTGLFTLLLV